MHVSKAAVFRPSYIMSGQEIHSQGLFLHVVALSEGQPLDVEANASCVCRGRGAGIGVGGRGWPGIIVSGNGECRVQTQAGADWEKRPPTMSCGQLPAFLRPCCGG